MKTSYPFKDSYDGIQDIQALRNKLKILKKAYIEEKTEH